MGSESYFFMNREKASLDSFWLRDESLEESHNLPDPDVLAQEIVEDLETALNWVSYFRSAILCRQGGYCHERAADCSISESS
jgi:hypothetical protein